MSNVTRFLGLNLGLQWLVFGVQGYIFSGFRSRVTLFGCRGLGLLVSCVWDLGLECF